MRFPILFSALLASCASFAYGQQFREPDRQSYDVMGLSDACIQVLNTELQHCDPLLFSRTDRSEENVVNVLPREELQQICKPDCRQELAELRVRIVDICTTSGDTIQHSGITYPPSLFLDKFAYTYDINCYKDKASDRFCDELRAEWRDGLAEVDECHECFLGPLASMVASPLGASDQNVALFKQTKAACKDIVYEPVIATTYAEQGANFMRTASIDEEKPTAPQECSRWYTMQKGDTCGDISRSQRTSTLNLVQRNSIDVNCVMMPEAGTRLCLDKPCDIHTIIPGETCASIAQKYSITERHFRSMNEMFDEKCSNVARWEGYVVCVGPQSLFAGSSQAGRFPEFSSTQANTTIAMTARKPLAPGSSSKCTMFANGRALTDPDLVDLWGKQDHLMTDDNMKLLNRCAYVAGLSNIYVGDFKKMNPSLMEQPKDEARGSQCYLDGRYSYCLAEEGGPKPDLGAGWTMRHALRWG